jgi:hypothetical protein
MELARELDGQPGPLAPSPLDAKLKELEKRAERLVTMNREASARDAMKAA